MKIITWEEIRTTAKVTSELFSLGGYVWRMLAEMQHTAFDNEGVRIIESNWIEKENGNEQLPNVRN